MGEAVGLGLLDHGLCCYRVGEAEERVGRRLQGFEGTSSRTLLRTSVVIALSGVAGARGCTGAMKAAALLRSAKATTSFIVASCFLSPGIYAHVLHGQ